MKVLMLGWELPPHNSGGLGVACLQLSEALARSGADIEFVLPYEHGISYPFMRISSITKFKPGEFIGPYDSFSFATGTGDFDYFSTYANMVSRLVEQTEFDIIHAHDWLTFRAALLAKEKSGRPLILHVHSIERDRAGGKPGNPLVREIEATAMLLADMVLAVSQRTKNAIVDDYKIPADKIEVVHNSIDINSLPESEPENAYAYLMDMKAQGWRVVVNVGRLTIQKGLTHLVRAARTVVETEPKTLFLIVGSGEQRDELLELAAELGISKNLILPGFQRGKNWRDAYAVGDLFVMPSVSEPFGLTPFEAAAYGTPSLISKQSGVAEVFKNCLKVDFWDEHEMANKIVGVLRSPALADSLRYNAWQEYQQLSWDRAADQIMDHYKRFAEKVAV